MPARDRPSWRRRPSPPAPSASARPRHPFPAAPAGQRVRPRFPTHSRQRRLRVDSFPRQGHSQKFLMAKKLYQRAFHRRPPSDGTSMTEPERPRLVRIVVLDVALMSSLARLTLPPIVAKSGPFSEPERRLLTKCVFCRKADPRPRNCRNRTFK